MTQRDDAIERKRRLDFYPILSGKPVPPQYQVEIPALTTRKARRTIPGAPSEAEILKAVLKFLRYHPRVAFAYRINSGTFEIGQGEHKRFVRANTQDGISDIGGMLKGGKAFYCECKSATGRMQENQTEFIRMVNKGGGLAFVARGIDDVVLVLGTP